MKLLLFLIASLFYSNFINAQIIATHKFESTTLENQMEIFGDSSKSLTIRDIISRKSSLAFKISNTKFPNYKNDHTPRWIHFKIVNPQSRIIPIYVRIRNPFIDTIAFYLVKRDSIISQLLFTRNMPYYARQSHSANPTGVFYLKKGELYDVYIYARRLHHNFKLPIEVLSRKEAQGSDNFENVIYLGQIGVFVILLILSIIIYLYYFETIILFYGFYTFFVGLTILTSQGYLSFFFGTKFPLLTGYYSIPFYGILMFQSYILFVFKLHKINISNSKILYYFSFCLFAIGLIIEIFGIIDINFYNSLNFAFIVPLFIGFILYVYVYTYQYNKIIFKPFLIAHVPIIVCSLSFYLFDNGIITLSRFTYASFSISYLFEIIIFLLLVAKYFFELRKTKTEIEKQILTTQIETQENERQQIAIDLHDDLGSTLSVLKEKIANELQNSDSQYLINKAIKDLRSISHNLLPADFEIFGFIPSLQKHIALLNESGLKITFIVFGEKKEFTSNVELNLYRILTELLHNIKKHSVSKEATVQLIYHKEFLYVAVEAEEGEKNGEKGSGIGEKAITSRLEYLHANVLENGNGQHGYSYIFEVPYDQNPNR